MLSLREWLIQNNVYLDQRLSIKTVPSLRVVANLAIEPNSTVARIPKSLVLSHRTSSLSRLLPAFPSFLHHLAPTVQLSIYVLYELQLGDRSRWKGYFDHCPKETVDIGLLWEEEGNARNWVKGTELERELRRIGITKTLLSTIFNTVVLPLFSALPSTSSLPLKPPRLDTFLYAYSLVSSRAFQVDTYHALALVPLADAFNHSSPNHVHFASDTWVCEECGQLEECPHDDSNAGEVRREEDGDGQTCDMVTTEEGVLEGEEVFNSYGNLSNARLIAEYGFALEANEWDTISFEEAEVHEVLGRPGAMSVDSDLTIRPSELEEEDHPLIAPPSSKFPRSLHFDADARLSHSLWTTAALSVLQRYRPKPADRQNDSERLDELAQTLAGLVEEEEKEELGEDFGIDETDAVILEGIAQIVINLCSTRLRGQYRPELTGTQLLDLAETAEDRREKLAIEFTAGERLLLERVKQNWNQFTKSVDGQEQCSSGSS
ncbi:hypothetical protein JCM5353_005707 [Sporobolomyces roseus]